MKKRRKNGTKRACLASPREGYPLDIPKKSQGYPSLNPAGTIFSFFFSTDISRNIGQRGPKETDKNGTIMIHIFNEHEKNGNL